MWTSIYILVAIAGWRVWHRGRAGAAMRLWWVQLVLNLAWSPVFFGMHAVAMALVVVIAMLVSIVLFIASSWKLDRPAALLFVPYGCWVAFALCLNAAIVWLN